MKQLPGYGRKTLIRPGVPGHLLPEGEGTIPTFSPRSPSGAQVAEGRMRAAPAGDCVLKVGKLFLARSLATNALLILWRPGCFEKISDFSPNCERLKSVTVTSEYGSVKLDSPRFLVTPALHQASSPFTT